MLIKCPRCGNDVSDKARECQKCGYKFDKKGTETKNVLWKRKIKITLFFIGILFLGIGLGWFVKFQSVEKDFKQSSEKIPSEEVNVPVQSPLENLDSFFDKQGGSAVKRELKKKADDKKD